MNYECFKNCFLELCHSFDLNYEHKKRSMQSYYSTRLGNLAEYDLMLLIKKARETLIVKSGRLPAIQQLLSVWDYNMPPRTQKSKDEESFHGAKCATCGSSGWVTMEKDGYTYAMCCTCSVGQIKQQKTILGRSSGCYKDYLDQGYKIHTIEASKDSKIEEKLLKVAYEAQKEEIPF